MKTEKVLYNNESEKETLINDKINQGKILLKVQNHIVKDDEGNEFKENALIFADSMPKEKKSIEQRLTDIEIRLDIMENN